MNKYMAMFGVLSFFSICALSAENKESKRVESSIDVLKDVEAIPDKTIPNYILEKARGVAIIPSVYKGAFVVGGSWGKGIIMERADNGSWSNPCFITSVGGSFGWQFGGESTDFVLIFISKRSVEGVASGKITLGGDISVAAGPVGRNAEASTDLQLKAEILSYAKSRGLFAGVAIEGTSLSVDENANAAFYNAKDIQAKTIFAGEAAKEPVPAKEVEALLTKITMKKKQ